jgi:DNA-binding XRE family transcriptional regulator
MPYKSEKIKIAGTKHDRRIKLTPEQKEEIYHNNLGLSQRELAREYGVSRRTIQFILDPEKLKENIKRRKERGGTMQYYKPLEWPKIMKEHRRYKQELKIKGEIK